MATNSSELQTPDSPTKTDLGISGDLTKIVSETLTAAQRLLASDDEREVLRGTRLMAEYNNALKPKSEQLDRKKLLKSFRFTPEEMTAGISGIVSRMPGPIGDHLRELYGIPINELTEGFELEGLSEKVARSFMALISVGYIAAKKATEQSTSISMDSFLRREAVGDMYGYLEEIGNPAEVSLEEFLEAADRFDDVLIAVLEDNEFARFEHDRLQPVTSL